MSLIHPDLLIAREPAMTVTFTAYDPTTETCIGEGTNVADRNAAFLLDTLGIQVGETWGERCGGELPAEDFLSRVVLALGLAPADAGLPATTDVDNPRWNDGGRWPGYLQDRLAELHGLAQTAADRGWEVVWS